MRRILFVFLSGCPTCADFLPVVKSFSTKNKIQMYSVDLNEIWGSNNSVTEIVKYAPSMIIYKDGKVIEFLESSNSEDYPYYKSEDKLEEWFKENIDIELFDKYE